MSVIASLQRRRKTPVFHSNYSHVLRDRDTEGCVNDGGSPSHQSSCFSESSSKLKLLYHANKEEAEEVEQIKLEPRALPKIAVLRSPSLIRREAFDDTRQESRSSDSEPSHAVHFSSASTSKVAEAKNSLRREGDLPVSSSAEVLRERMFELAIREKSLNPKTGAISKERVRLPRVDRLENIIKETHPFLL